MIRKLLILSVLLFPQYVLGEELTDEKKQVIDEMLELTGALKIGEMMGVNVANQMIAMMSRNNNVSPEIVVVVRDEVTSIMHDEFIANHFLNEISYTIYHKYFTIAELQEMVAFYKTPTGAKMASLMPQVTQEAMLAGQKHGATLGPVIQQRLQARFAKEGIQ